MLNYHDEILVLYQNYLLFIN